jgi:CubicO group peptidase (beta-lactamase class C family)
MSIRISIGRRFPSARAVGLSSTALANLMIAACSGPATVINPGENPVTSPPPQNAAPVANAGTAPAPTLPTDTVVLTGSATDDGLPAGSTISYTWEYVSGPNGPGNTAGATVATPNAASSAVKFTGGHGDYLFNLKASDGSLTGTSQLHVTVKPAIVPSVITPTDSGWETATPADANMDVTKLDAAKNYSIAAGVTGNEAGYIIRGGKLVYSWGNPNVRYEMKSTTKSMGGLALLLALDEGKIALSDKVSAKIPAVFGTNPVVDTSAVTTGGLADVTVMQLATHTAGFSKSDQTGLKLLYTPGTTWWYSDQGLNWLADVLTQTYAQDLNTLLSTRIYTTLGVRANIDLTWRNNAFRSDTLDVGGTAIKRREFASGINANVNAMARVGQLMLRKGVWGTQRLLSEEVVAKVRTPPAEVATAALPDATNFPGATTNYSILWWTNATGQIAGVPTDAYWAWGLHETFIIIVPSKDLVIARAGDHAWHPTNSENWNADYQVLAPFITPIVQAAQ